LVSLALRGHELLHSLVVASHHERGHEGPLVVGRVRGILVIIDLIKHLGAGRLAWGPASVEDLRVCCPRYRPGGPSCGGGSRG
jgi:hypothetical protein